MNSSFHGINRMAVNSEAEGLYSYSFLEAGTAIYQSQDTVCDEQISLNVKLRADTPSHLPVSFLQTSDSWATLSLPPVYDSSLISFRNCSSPPPSYTPLPTREDALLQSHPCSCGQRKEPRRKRLVTILIVIIMILLSITLGVAWKHWELVREDTNAGEDAGEVLEENIDSTEDI